MWQYDLTGELCFQQAINGMLTDLCCAWKERSCTHDVTIVMAARVVYDATSIEQFPEDLRRCIQLNSKNQYFEDFYDVVIQNERSVDWSDTLMALNKTFIGFDKQILRSDRNDIPRHRIASNSEAPLLESINVVLNVTDTIELAIP